jgi:hypothetical protein
MRSVAILLSLIAGQACACDTWQSAETAPTNRYVMVSAGTTMLGGHKYRTTYLAYWAEHLSADHVKEWRDASSHQKLPYKVYAWREVPRQEDL